MHRSGQQDRSAGQVRAACQQFSRSGQGSRSAGQQARRDSLVHTLPDHTWAVSPGHLSLPSSSPASTQLPQSPLPVPSDAHSLPLQPLSTHLFVDLHIDGLKLAESQQVGAHQQTQLLALALPTLPVPRVALVLHPHPQLVHLGEVEQDEVDRVADLSARPGGSPEVGHGRDTDGGPA